MALEEGAAEPNGGRPEILLLEDELMIALDMQSALEEAGVAKAHLAGNVDTALDLLARMERLAAAILDVNLSGGNSLRLAEALRARNIPFAFATGYDTSSDVLSRFADVPVLAKPFDESELLRVARQLLNDR